MFWKLKWAQSFWNTNQSIIKVRKQGFSNCFDWRPQKLSYPSKKTLRPLKCRKFSLKHINGLFNQRKRLFFRNIKLLQVFFEILRPSKRSWPVVWEPLTINKFMGWPEATVIYNMTLELWFGRKKDEISMKSNQRQRIYFLFSVEKKVDFANVVSIQFNLFQEEER